MASKTSVSHNTILTWAATAAFVALPFAFFQYQRNAEAKRKERQDNESLSSMARGGSQIKPPFPELIREMLSKCRLAYLSTVDSSLASSHLSLMRFTYLNDPEDGEVVIMSTNKKTKKFDMLQEQKGVALLVHDFGGVSAGLYSITLNGNCRIVENIAKADHYRRMHLSHNPY